MILVILVTAIAETGWAILCAEASVNLALFYLGLVAASITFFVPGITGKKNSENSVS